MRTNKNCGLKQGGGKMRGIFIYRHNKKEGKEKEGKKGSGQRSGAPNCPLEEISITHLKEEASKSEKRE